MQIRKECQEDYGRVETLTREAFWNLYVPGASEHYIVHVIRSRPEFMADLSLVAELDGRIVGSIVYSRAFIETPEKERVSVLTFGPLSVEPQHHGRGIGASLVEASLKGARALGERAVCILGYPGYYERFGFRNAADFGVSMAGGAQPWAFQGLELVPGALTAAAGIFEASEVFEPDPQAVAAFDGGFPKRERFRTRSQAAFERALCLQHGDAVPAFVLRDACAVVRI